MDILLKDEKELCPDTEDDMMKKEEMVIIERKISAIISNQKEDKGRIFNNPTNLRIQEV